MVVGHSFGGGAVIAFGARRGGVDGVVALAAGPDPASPISIAKHAESVAKAESMMAAGRADVLTAFADFNGPYQGRTVTTPARYLSFYSPDSDLSIHRNLAIWPDGLPLLWIDGSEEGRHPARQRMVRSRIPRSGPLTRYLSVPAEHTMVADAAADIVLAWIKCL